MKITSTSFVMKIIFLFTFKWLLTMDEDQIYAFYLIIWQHEVNNALKGMVSNKVVGMCWKSHIN